MCFAPQKKNCLNWLNINFHIRLPQVFILLNRKNQLLGAGFSINSYFKKLELYKSLVSLAKPVGK
jgi:hypothetical protein